MHHVPHVPRIALTRRQGFFARRQVVLQTDAARKFDPEVSLLAVVADRERRANVECALRCRGFFRCLGLLEKINVRLVVIIFHQIGCFIETNPAQTAGRIHVPRAGNVLGLLSIFVRHKPSFTRRTAAEQSFF